LLIATIKHKFDSHSIPRKIIKSHPWNRFFKMSRAQAEAVIKNIIREIVQECSTRGQIVSETLVAFTVNSCILSIILLFKLFNLN
jgi:hypothetical protein